MVAAPQCTDLVASTFKFRRHHRQIMFPIARIGQSLCRSGLAVVFEPQWNSGAKPGENFFQQRSFHLGKPVRTARMPQPMSTPTALGMTTPVVARTPPIGMP